MSEVNYRVGIYCRLSKDDAGEGEYAEQDGARRPQPWCTQNAQMVQSGRVNGAQEETSV